MVRKATGDIASPTGDELEIKCSNLAVVVELLRKMSM